MPVAFVSLQEREAIKSYSEARLQEVINQQSARLQSERYRTARGNVKSAISREVQNITSAYKAELQRRAVEQRIRSGAVSQEAGEKFLRTQQANLQQQARPISSRIAESNQRRAFQPQGRLYPTPVREQVLRGEPIPSTLKGSITAPPSNLVERRVIKAGEPTRSTTLTREQFEREQQASLPLQTGRIESKGVNILSGGNQAFFVAELESKKTPVGSSIVVETQADLLGTKKKGRESEVLSFVKGIPKFEREKITPKLRTFFEITPEQLKADKERAKTQPKSEVSIVAGKIGDVTGRITGRELKPEVKSFFATAPEKGEQTYIGVAEFLSRPITKVAPTIILGAVLPIAEAGILKGVTKVPFLFEAITTPQGQFVYQTGKVSLGLLYAKAQAVRIATSEQPFQTFGTVLGETASLSTGAKGGSAIVESGFVRRSFFGSPSRSIEERYLIKGITEEGLKTARETRPKNIKVAPEIDKLTATELQKELLAGSELVSKQRLKYKPEINPLTVEELFKVETIGTRSRAKKALQIFETEDITLKGSITTQLSGGRNAGDVDFATGNIKGVKAKLGKKGILKAFDIKPESALLETSTAQIEPLRTTTLPSGKKIKLTGQIEQYSRKLEGSIRYATGQEGGERRGKDIADVFSLGKKIREETTGKKPLTARILGISSEVEIQSKFGMRRSERRLVEKMESNVEKEFRRKPTTQKPTSPRTQRASKPSNFVSFGKNVKPSIISFPSSSKNKSSSNPLSYRPSSPSSKPSRSPSPSSSPSVSISPSISPSPSYTPSSKPSSKSRSPSPSSSISPSTSPSFSYSATNTYRNTYAKPPPLRFGGGGDYGSKGLNIKLKNRYAPSLYGSTFRIKAKRTKGTFTGLEIRGIQKTKQLKGGFLNERFSL